MAVAQSLVRGRDPAGSARRGRAAPLTAALGALALALSGCAAGGPAAGAAAQGGPEPAVTVWEAEGGAPRAVILAVHGYGDHAVSTFGEAAEFWAGRGFEVRAYDHRGFGRNPDRGAWPGADALIADFAAVAAATAAARPDLPLIVLGHSMGAGVALAGIGEGRAPEADALVLAGAAIGGGAAINPLARGAAWTVATLAPDRRWSGEGLVTFQASDDVAMLRRLARDPLYIGRPSAREILGLIRIMDRAAAAAPAARLPVLALHGRRDELVPLESVERVLADLPAPAALTVYEEGWHLLFRDLQKRRVWEDVAAFARAIAEGAA
jgi:alpha-beta hydrolase superfamily lysophospholipase